ncbi:RND transporter [Thioalkalicoccus limnaeus]|uniref:RND transporter n=1 Tax=Thioalkalicoccus limnaeus TaxID=120681 RepID=A0ABV4BK14_9GAMM
MNRFLHWLDGVPLPILILAAALIGLSPFYPEPHLWEKSKMLVAGTLVRPIDIVDLLFHATPVALLLVRLGRDLRRRVRG